MEESCRVVVVRKQASGLCANSRRDERGQRSGGGSCIKAASVRQGRPGPDTTPTVV
jgi:hypothetical protein